MGNAELALPLHRESLESRRRVHVHVLGSQHPDTLASVFNLGASFTIACDHAAAIPLLQEALAGLAIVYGPEHPHTRTCQRELEFNERWLANPTQAAAAQRQHRLRRQQKAAVVQARILTAAATNPELSGTTVHVLKYTRNHQERNIILLQPELCDTAMKSLCSPASLVLAVGTAVIVSGLTGAPELNGRTGVIEGFDDEKGRYAVRLAGRKKPAALRPGNCLAAVPGSAAA